MPQTLKHKLYSFFTFFLLLIIGGNAFSQVETVPVTHPVYDYLKIMQIKKVIPDYNTSVTPFTRNDIASYLKKIGDSKNLSRTEKKQLEDFQIEFEYEINKTLKNTTSLFSRFDESSLFGNKKQKYLYKYADSNATLFMGLAGELYSRSLKADGGDHSILIGNLGLGIRGTLYGRLGYTLNITGGQRFSGKNADLQFAVDNDPVLKTNRDFISGNKSFDFFTGNLRFQTKAKWFSLTLGREALNCGYGYIDKLFLSNNTVPFDFLKLDLAYKKVKYTFTYGSLQGDSLGAELKSKNIAFHRINIQFSDVFKAGFYESVIMSNNPFSFVFFNPISFITSADLNTGAKQTTENNTLMGFDFEINPIKNVALQGSILIDDINMSTIFKNDETSFDNKIGYQAGSIWANAFQIPDIDLTLEYTRLNPFIYSHRSNKDSYTHWGLSLGHELPPNSDEIALKLKYYISNRLVVNFLYQFQRSAQGIYFDSTINKLINYGGTINRGDGDEVINNKFLLGDRINRNIFTIDFIFEPIKQYTFELLYQHKYLNFIYLSKKEQESQFYAVFKVFF